MLSAPQTGCQGYVNLELSESNQGLGPGSMVRRRQTLATAASSLLHAPKRNTLRGGPTAFPKGKKAGLMKTMAFLFVVSMGRNLSLWSFATALLLAASTSPCTAQPILVSMECPSCSNTMTIWVIGPMREANPNHAAPATWSSNGYASMPFQPNGYYSSNFGSSPAALRPAVLEVRHQWTSPSAYPSQAHQSPYGFPILGRVRARMESSPTRLLSTWQNCPDGNCRP